MVKKEQNEPLSVNIQSPDVKPYFSFSKEIEQKVQILKKYFENIVKVEIYLRIETERRNIKPKTIKIKVLIPNSVMFAESTQMNFPSALGQALNALINKVKKTNQKKKSLRNFRNKWALAA